MISISIVWVQLKCNCLGCSLMCGLVQVINIVSCIHNWAVLNITFATLELVVAKKMMIDHFSRRCISNLPRTPQGL
jgi:hypothetical protein